LAVNAVEDKPVEVGVQVPELRGDVGFCEYCKAPLDANFYFCLGCATPYKALSSVLTDVRPKPLTEGMLISKKAPYLWPMFWTYVAVVVGTAVLCYLLFRDGRPAFTIIFQTITLFVTTCIFAALHWPSLAVQFKRFGLLQPEALLGVLALAPMLAINYLYHGWLIDSLGAEEARRLSELYNMGLGRPFMIVVICVFPAVLEEIAFRGLFQHWLQIALSPMRALVLASALFTAMHFSILSAPYLFALGMLLGWVKWKTRSLYPPILIHFLHNFIAIELIRW
jgi:membrane protease YdiL (CAAX protease family)